MPSYAKQDTRQDTQAVRLSSLLASHCDAASRQSEGGSRFSMFASPAVIGHAVRAAFPELRDPIPSQKLDTILADFGTGHVFREDVTAERVRQAIGEAFPEVFPTHVVDEHAGTAEEIAAEIDALSRKVEDLASPDVPFDTAVDKEVAARISGVLREAADILREAVFPAPAAIYPDDQAEYARGTSDNASHGASPDW